VDTALSAAITHNDPASIAACVGFVRLLWELLGMAKPPPRDWWGETWIETAQGIEGETAYRGSRSRYRDYEGPVWRFTQERLREARKRRFDVLTGCDRWGSGAYLLETVPSVLHILSLHGGNPKRAIIRAVNDTWDNDTCAAIVGAAVGALHGRSGLPKKWVEKLTGRTAHDDDGRVFELISEARENWGRGRTGSGAAT
jgi:ADP-ribosylglycohydrolase